MADGKWRLWSSARARLCVSQSGTVRRWVAHLGLTVTRQRRSHDRESGRDAPPPILCRNSHPPKPWPTTQKRIPVPSPPFSVVIHTLPNRGPRQRSPPRCPARHSLSAPRTPHPAPAPREGACLPETISPRATAPLRPDATKDRRGGCRSFARLKGRGGRPPRATPLWDILRYRVKRHMSQTGSKVPMEQALIPL